MIILSIVLPVHNEEELIENVTLQLHAFLKKKKIDSEIILVENGSTDNSYKIIKNLSSRYKNIVSTSSKKGYGNAILRGYKIAKGKYLCHMPSDGQIDIKVLPKLIKGVDSGNYDLLKVKRLNRENLGRLVVSKIFNLTIMILFQIPYYDINGDPKLFKRSNLKKLNLTYSDSFIDAELMINASKLKWKMKELPMKHLDRAGGKSTRSIGTFTEFFGNTVRYRLFLASKNN